MRILCSNDDGLPAEGLAVLIEICARIGEVTCVAPDREQSATSHSLTLARPLRPVRRGERTWQVDGTPTDSVLLALGALAPERPDFVVSGINHGPNMGEDVLYSGTVAAAMEGLAFGIPGVAVSYAGTDSAQIRSYGEILERLLRQLLSVERFPQDTLLNVNLPASPAAEVKGVRVTTLGKRVYSDSLTKMRDPWGRDIWWIGGGQISWSGREDSDFQAIQDGFISVTPLHVDITNYQLLETVRAWGLSV
jgi:5'-nucleotidase